MTKVGNVIRYYKKTKIAVISLISDLFVGEKIRFVSDKFTPFEQEVNEILINYKKCNFAKAGTVIGFITNDEVETQTEVFKS